jgi:peroxiredoxin
MTRGIDMPQIEIRQQAPDFSLPDMDGNQVNLSDFRGRRSVVLVLNRGFT